MPYNYLGLVNDINRSLNEVELSSSNFSSAMGVYNDNKNAVNAAIRKISQEAVDWPFNHVTQTFTLTPNVVRYSYPVDAKKVVFDSFRLKGNSDLNVGTRLLFNMDYEDYLQGHSDMEYRVGDYASVPNTVFRAPNLTFGIIPPSSEAYEIVYEYYRLPVDLEDWDDVPSIPVNFKYVIKDGAMYYAYMFRGDAEAATIQEQKFLEGIKDMRSIYINRYEYVRGTQRR